MSSATASNPAAIETTVAPEKSLAFAVVEAIAVARGTDPEAVDLQLADHVDLDALNALYAHASASGDASWRVEFRAGEFEVTVRSDGHITVL